MSKEAWIDGTDSIVVRYTGKPLEELQALSPEDRRALIDALPLDRRLEMWREVLWMAEEILVDAESFRDKGLALYRKTAQVVDDCNDNVLAVLRLIRDAKPEDEQAQEATDA